MKKAGTLLLLIFLTVSAFGQDTVRLGIEEAIRLGVSRSVEAAAARSEYISAYWDYRTYRTELLPELTLSGTLPYYSKSYNSKQQDDGTYTYVASNYNRLNAGLRLTQNIPWTGGTVSVESTLERLRQGGASGYTNYRSIPFLVNIQQPLVGFNSYKWLMRIEPVRYEEARKKFVSEQETIAVTVIRSYFNLLEAEMSVEIARQNRNIYERLYDIEKARRELGRTSEVALQSMKTSLVKSEIALSERQATLEERMFALRSLLGFDQETILQPEVPELWSVIPALSPHEVLEYARENHYSMQEIHRRQLQAERDVSQAKANRWSVRLNASVGMSGRENTFSEAMSSANWRDDQIVNVTLSVPILDWGKGKAKVRQAEAVRESTEARLQRDLMDFYQELTLLVADFNRHPRLLSLARELDETAQDRYRTTVEAFVQEKMDILSLHSAEQDKDEARKNYIDRLGRLWRDYYLIRAYTSYDFLSQSRIQPVFPLEK